VAGQTGGVDVTAILDSPCSAGELFSAVDDLATYPTWLSIVTKVVATDADETGGEPGPAWVIDLRGRLGPLARSKRLRMVRTALEAPTHIRFERREVDGRSHSAWVLDVEVEASSDGGDAHPDGEASGSRLTMRLHYDGSFGGTLLERMLRDEIEQSRPKLLERVAGAGKDA